MKRREFLDAGLRIGGLAGLAGCAPRAASAPEVHTAQRVRWRLASSFPRGLDTIYGGAEVLAERLELLSEGRFTVRPHQAGEIVPPLQVLDAVQQGTVQLGHTATYYFTGKNPALAFGTAMPFGLNARQQNAWLYEGGGIDLMNEVCADFSMLFFPGGNTGTQMGGWFRREVPTLADLNGLTMRIPGLGGEVMNRLGVTVQVLGGGDIYPALERGAIDATEWVGPYDDEKLGFHRVASYYYAPGWWEPGPSLGFLVNQRAWDSLPTIYQEMFVTAAHQANIRMLALYDSRNPAALTRLVDSGTQLRRFSDEILEASRQSSTELMQEQAAADPLYRKIYDNWRQFRSDSYRWFAVAEQSLSQFSFPARL